MTTLKMHSPNLVDDNIAKIATLFPNCITEKPKTDEQGNPVKDKDGNIIIETAIDFDQLKQELSHHLIDGNQERYRLDWVGKKEAILTANSPIAKTLRPCRDESVNFDTTSNLFIEGDNLEALKLLQESYLGAVKMIYIDPPYNTGNDFIYNDDFSEDTESFFARSGQVDDNGNRLIANTESNGRFHSDWLSMMYSRLKLARNLLSDDGVIFISIDDNEVDNLKKIADEVFGSYNFISQFPWQSRQSMQNDTDISINHEYILAFAKNRRQENRRLKETNANMWFADKSFAFNPLPLDKEKFDNPDNDPRGLWKADPFDAPNIRPNLTYPIINPNTGEEYYPPQGRHWRTEQKTYEKLLADNRIVFGKTGNSRPQLKVFYEEKKMFGSVDNSWWTGERYGTTTQGTKEIISLFGSPVFDTPKPVSLLSNLLRLATRQDQDAIILDFFCGSATTAHAVMQLNAEDGGNRQFIMVQLPEKTDKKSEAFKAGFKTISEISKERIRRAGAKIQADNADKAGIADLDIGFRVLKIDTSNMADIYYRPDDYRQDLLDGLVDTVKADRSDEDLLFQFMLDTGVPLSLPIVCVKIQGRTVYQVGGNSLVASLDYIDAQMIDDIARLAPIKFVTSEQAIASDSDKTNIIERFKQLSPHTDVRFI